MNIRAGGNAHQICNRTKRDFDMTMGTGAQSAKKEPVKAMIHFVQGVQYMCFISRVFQDASDPTIYVPAVIDV